MLNDSLIGIIRFIKQLGGDEVLKQAEFETLFNTRFPESAAFTRFMAGLFYKISIAASRVEKLVRDTRICRYLKLGPAKAEPASGKHGHTAAIKKPLILSQVDQQISIEDVLHSDVQLAINSKPIHVKYYTYQMDYDSFFKFLDADLKKLKDLKR